MKSYISITIFCFLLLISLDGADHLLSDNKDSIYARKMIATWAKRYI
jgi:hypothetical protein